jgi:hypothetical protein
MADELILAENGQSAYQIVVADNASPSTKHGAEELQMFLAQITGVKLPIVSEKQPQTDKEIIVGNNAHLKKLGVAIDVPSLGSEGYVLRTVGNSLLIVGGELRGNMYGVYGLLEDHLGCRWFAPGVSRIPKQAKLVLSAIDERQIPSLEYREPFMADCFDGDWCARNRMNSSAGRLKTKHGGKVAIWCIAHSWQWLVPVEKYFDAHPEYFCMIDEKRRKDYPQLCCTNPDVIRICTEEVRKQILAHPDLTVFGVSQNDWDHHCECPNCKALYEREGSLIAPGLELANRVGEALEKEFPDKAIQTLAYSWSRKPPKHMRPRSNVIVMLCSIECCFSHPLDRCDTDLNRAFCKDVEDWSKVASRLWIWDYTTDFGNFLMPFPNQRVLAPNIRFFAAHNVKGIFEEDNADSCDGELVSLNGYVMAKLLWNPKYDPNLATNEFLNGFYGSAAKPIRAYIDLLHDHVERNNIHVNIWATPTDSMAGWQDNPVREAFRNDPAPVADKSHLPDSLLIESNRFWQQAEEAVAGQPELLDRVRRGRMSVDFAILERAQLEARKRIPKNDAFVKLAVERFNPFFETFKKSPITHIKERDVVDKEKYRREMAKFLGIKTP